MLRLGDAGPGAPRPGPATGRRDTLPPLTPPAGVFLRSHGGHGGPDEWTSQAVAQTDRPAAEIEEHFAQQLAAAGWTRQTGGVNGPLAWSRWRVPDGANWQGLLMVVEEPEMHRRRLLVCVELPQGESRPDTVGSGGVFVYRQSLGSPGIAPASP